MTNDNFCIYLQNRVIQTSEIGGQQYSDPSPFSFLWSNYQEPELAVFNFKLASFAKQQGRVSHISTRVSNVENTTQGPNGTKLVYEWAT
jgi:hypothetical protein